MAGLSVQCILHATHCKVSLLIFNLFSFLDEHICLKDRELLASNVNCNLASYLNMNMLLKNTFFCIYHNLDHSIILLWHLPGREQILKQSLQDLSFLVKELTEELHNSKISYKQLGHLRQQELH